jgi:hypothetical protein
VNDFWEWDPMTNIWTPKANVPGFPRVEASAFSLNGFGYLGMGSGFGIYYSDFYQYNATTNTWAIRATYGGGPTEEATQFSLGPVGYVGTGYDGQSPGVLKNDFWAYLSEDSTTNVEATLTELTAKLFPNPCLDELHIELRKLTDKPVGLTLLDSRGRMLHSGQMPGPFHVLDVSELARGHYTLILTISDDQRLTHSFSKH